MWHANVPLLFTLLPAQLLLFICHVYIQFPFVLLNGGGGCDLRGNMGGASCQNSAMTYLMKYTLYSAKKLYYLTIITRLINFTPTCMDLFHCVVQLLWD